VIAASGYQRHAPRVASYSPKGGVGTLRATMGVNLATLLGIVANRPTILIDANMNGGHVALHLNLKHSYTIYTLARDFLMHNNVMTPALARQHVTHYDGSLDVLVGISRMEQAGEEYLAGQQGEAFISNLLETAQQMADFVVLDMGSSYNNALHRAALKRAHAILLLVTPDVSAVEDARKALETLKLFMDVSRDRVQLVTPTLAPSAAQVQVSGRPSRAARWYPWRSRRSLSATTLSSSARPRKARRRSRCTWPRPSWPSRGRRWW
jgi:MinD-like ATPase involved in chromosome partitioning or flagellar assembly